jgi:hypothetical protein
MLQKEQECGEGKVEEWKQNWDEVFMNEVRRERERKRERGREREKVKCQKCLETEKDEKFNTPLRLSFYVLKIKSK